MKIRTSLILASTLGLSLAAQTPPAPAAPPAAPAPAPPAPGTVKWRGAFWGSGATSDQDTADGSLFLRSMDAGNGQLSLDGLQVGADVTLADGFSLKFTLLAGQDGKVLNAATLSPSGSPTETGSIAWPEAQLIWTGGDETIKIGRMYTAMGMEVMDDTQDITASRGLLFTYALPFAQVGLDWHHAFSTVWSSDIFVYNGEDRVVDNNTGKSYGLGLTYNHAGAADKFVTLMAFSGPEQTSIGSQAVAGAEGRKRNRVSLDGQWVWGSFTVVFEGESASETLPGAGQPKAKWSGAGLIGKYQFTDAWAGFARIESLKDDYGVRLTADTSVGAAIAQGPNADLTATSFALGIERKWHSTFSRLEVRSDSLNKDVFAGPENTLPFKKSTSATWSVGTSF